MHADTQTPVSGQVNLALMVRPSEPVQEVHEFFQRDEFLDFYRDPYRNVTNRAIKTILSLYGPSDQLKIQAAIPSVLQNNPHGAAISNIFFSILGDVVKPDRAPNSPIWVI